MLQKFFVKSLVLTALLGFTALPAFAQEDTAEKAQEDDKKTLSSIMAEYNKAYSDFMKAYREEKDPAAKRKLVTEKLPKKDDYARAIFELVEEDPKSDEALKALNWVQSGLRDQALTKKATALMLEHHIESEQMGQLAMSITRGMPSQEIEDTLAKIIEKNPHVDVKGRATFSLLNYYTGLARYTSDKEILKRIEAMGNKALVEYLKSKKEMEVSAKVDDLIAAIENDYSDVTLSPRTKVTIGAKVKAIIFERDNLQIGMEVPDINAEDIDGVEFKLSDYRGKVVFLDFWGDW